MASSTLFHKGQSEELPAQVIGTGQYTFGLAYATNRFPVLMQEDEDVKVYSEYLANPPGLVSMSGTVCRVVDFEPYCQCAMHRTVSLDYGVVLEGEVELILDSGETRLLRRGTNHAWKNVTPNREVDGQMVGSWARMLYVLAPCEPLQVIRGILGESARGIGVRESS
ncbi:hypothetical protein BO83DRAFT_401886 [Aspergillus eucalypticola CBS 122712]|uniref:Cupin 2 conserved barrel domain-containing protein n=1 Tax=Aspergillus eucalypticola (strain CBS 122712 / IBT 29274) TaxID=1448314 RepID=A0A317UVD2_ASPEC|nr:uncharacterized protein BO83DRAFT_401886 [Aspergillus eucalypticola CBS 122712]PWY65411.1 hypothetical protein BO83DRAFT_401886 [Aspergillus eucalypticola CBS 122712]